MEMSRSFRVLDWAAVDFAAAVAGSVQLGQACIYIHKLGNALSSNLHHEFRFRFPFTIQANIVAF